MTVKRGDFLRAAVSALRVQFVNSTDIQYSGVPASLLPYVRTAAPHGALQPFYDSRGILDLTKDITRGEALEVVVALADQKMQGTNPSYADVTTSGQKQAVSVGVQKQWMRPLRSTVFGFNVPLTLAEERLLLKKAAADTAPPQDTGTTVHITVGTPSSTLPKETLLEQVWGLLNDQYLYKDKLKGDEAAYSAAQGLVKSLNDPYTVFMPPTSTSDFQTQLQGEVTGIGAQVEQKSGKLVIVAPLPGSPAQKAGLISGDIILSVDGTSLDGMDYEEAVHHVRGPKGSTAALVILRGSTQMNVSVVRDTVRISELDISTQNNVAVVALHQFGQSTDRSFRDQMSQLAQKHPRALILDLRNNPGGLLDAAGVVTSAFLPDKSPYVMINTGKSSETQVTDGTPIFGTDVPMVVLVNRGSASAAEIVTGALQDAGRAKVLGEKTFGKGTVQQVVDFSDGSSLKMTIAEWKTPKGRKIDGLGVMPDIVVGSGATMGTTDEPLQKAFDILR